jgi:hypothetical protein
MSAITCTMMVSLVAATTPLQARAARRLWWLVARACQMLVRTTSMPKKMLVGLRPKMFDSGTMKMLAKPRVMTFRPVRSESCCWSRWNSWARKGNMGARLRAEHTKTQT